MVGMPYHLEKGPWLTILEDYLNGERGRSLQFLTELRGLRSGGGLMRDIAFLDTPALDADPDNPNPAARRKHLGEDWFGGDGNKAGFPAAVLDQLRSSTAAGEPDVVALLDPGDASGAPIATAKELQAFALRVAATVDATPGARLNGWPATGFWFQYFGDVDAIMRETLIRSIEVSLGLEHDEVPANGRTDRWMPIELFWKCPQRWFEGWVGWRWDATHGSGQVTTMLATPGSGKPVLEHPGLGQAPLGEPHAVIASPLDVPAGPPPDGDGPAIKAKGLWVITHQEHAQLSTTPDEGGTASGQWFVPPFGPTYVGVGDVICYEPHEFDGGVNPAGRAYVAPSEPVATP